MFGYNYTTLTKNSVDIVADPQLFILIDNRFYIIFLIGLLFSFPWWKKVFGIFEDKFSPFMTNFILYMRYVMILILFILSYSSIADNSYNPFIYFRF